MRRRVSLLALLLSTVARAIAAAQPPPVVVWQRGAVSLKSLPDVLSERAVDRHLGTGLTTRFAFTLRGEGGSKAFAAAAQVRVRYDLWDERFQVERWDGRGDSPLASTMRREELTAWWRGLALVFPLAAPGAQRPPASAKVELLVLPFSQVEQRDAQDWLLRSFRSQAADDQAQAVDGGGAANGPLRAFYGALLAASIGQRSLLTYAWTVAVRTE